MWCNLSPSLYHACLPETSVGLDHRCATLNCNTWFHKPALNQQANSAPEILVDTDDTERVTTVNTKVPAGIFLWLCQTVRQGT